MAPPAQAAPPPEGEVQTCPPLAEGGSPSAGGLGLPAGRQGCPPNPILSGWVGGKSDPGAGIRSLQMF